ncbi:MULTISPECIES: PH domain-containing protein [Bacillales]|uniref:PH domain-containing protein n=1 Tax=Lysinibacillus louembei TaxID=1470088 RepID=A0ABZ0S0Y5_9BACI|nr:MULTISPECIES: PH domain-containing protein [Bacillales]MCT6924756.1 PH domain-containing protein [Metasolibacillus sp.]MCT6940891.1 PH domain-containing protein [Metasolibacillus sp.]WPK12678.1 PH domain-containing protein [Lysinibacillus louembei]
MFKKFASDALGLSDIGVVVPKEDFDKTDSDDFIFNEIDEQIYFLIKTKADEYCFTNYALIHVDGANAISKKRLLRRYDYEHATIESVLLETAGTIDLDVEIKFTIGDIPMSIDIHKKFLNEIKDLYKALHAISLEQKSNTYKFDSAKQSLSLAASALGRVGNNEVAPASSFEDITKFSHEWLLQQKKQYVKKDYGDVFERYIHN